MLLFSDFVDAPYLLLSACALFSASPLAAATLPTRVLDISSPVPLKYSIIVITFCHYYRDLTVSLYSAPPTIESLSRHLIFDHVDLTYIHENRLVVGCVLHSCYSRGECEFLYAVHVGVNAFPMCFVTSISQCPCLDICPMQGHCFAFHTASASR